MIFNLKLKFKIIFGLGNILNLHIFLFELITGLKHVNMVLNIGYLLHNLLNSQKRYNTLN